MGTPINPAYWKLHCFIHKETIYRDKYHKGTDILKIKFKERIKTQRTDFSFSFMKIHSNYLLHCRWKASLIRWPINTTPKGLFSNPLSNRNMGQNWYDTKWKRKEHHPHPHLTEGAAESRGLMPCSGSTSKPKNEPWPVLLSSLERRPDSPRLWVRSLVRTHTRSYQWMHK